ncbi:MAG TPA: hypothetical protein VLH40_03940 [Atribacteraceae bacterium]|nr:hypothetical protein [Atribacteraceae bacterium]
MSKRPILTVLSIALLAVALAVVLAVAGCARGEQPPWGDPGDSLILDAFFEAAVDPDFIYWFAVDTDGDPLSGPDTDPRTWPGRGFYVVRFEDNQFFLTRPDGREEFFREGAVIDLAQLRITLSLADLENPADIQVMVVVTDWGGSPESYLREFRNLRTATDFFPRPWTDIAGDPGEPASSLSRVEPRIGF